MNVSELARRTNMRQEELLEILPEFGFDIGKRAIKIDERIAQNIMKEWPRISREIARRKGELEKKRRLTEKQERQASGKVISLPEVMTVKDLSMQLQVPITTLMRELMRNGILAALNDRIDFDTATIIGEDMGFSIERVGSEGVKAQEVAPTEHETAMKDALEKENEAELVERAPVIVVMGHVDHGKTKLLDSIRSTNVIDTESGGITQHIGAYQVVKKDKKLTFIDTPGHEAFTVMRSRGARVADIAILVVAADDGVMPQTKEAINIIKAAKLPFVVALNKIDKPGANLDKAKTQLSEAGVLIEDYGGDVPLVAISAKAGTGIDQLLDVLLLVADVHKDKIRANPNRGAMGTVIDSRVDKGLGPVATVLVQAGTLHLKDNLVMNGQLYGRVRAMKDFTGKDVKIADPGMPVKILGFVQAPEVGDILDVARENEAETLRKTKTQKSHVFATTSMATKRNEDGEEVSKKMLAIAIKADTLGSMEAILQSLETIEHPEVGVKIVGRGLGNISESDIAKAEGTDTILYAFHVATTPLAVSLANHKNIPIRTYKVIYDLLADVKRELEKKLEPEIITTVFGKATILKIFRQDKKKHIVGCRLDDGKLVPGLKVKIWRDGQELGEGMIETLKSGKSEAKEIRAGQEFGMELVSRTVVLEGDTLEGFHVEKKEKKLSFKVAV